MPTLFGSRLQVLILLYFRSLITSQASLQDSISINFYLLPFRYHWGMDLWKRLFDKCLNIPSCEELPDIVSIRREMEKALKARLSQPREFKTFVNSLKDLSIMYWEA